MSGFINPRPLVMCGPSGSGKSTLLQKMFEEFPNSFGFSTSHTTRRPRFGEVDGEHYHFTTKSEMRKLIEDGQFLEHAEFCGNLYGTSKAAVDYVRRQGKVCVLDIDVQGVKQVKRTALNPWYVFVKPPSLEALRERLLRRNTETSDTLSNRLKAASQEIEYGTEPGNFDLVIVNDNLEHAYAQLRAFLLDHVLGGKIPQ